MSHASAVVPTSIGFARALALKAARVRIQSAGSMTASCSPS